MIILLAVNFTPARVTAQNTQLKQISWLPGTWVMQMKNGTSYEIWHLANDSTFESRCYILKATGDTIPQENAQLAYRNKQLYYIPTVHGQNNNKPVVFKITSIKENEFVAENPEHDFPQRIIYILKSPGHLYASIEGTYNNKFQKEEYNMVKGE